MVPLPHKWGRKGGVGAILALLTTAALAQTASPLLAGRWLAPDADPVKALAYEPTECLAVPQDPDAALQVEVGRAAFRTPLLLGGQAARAGLSCESCHRGGRGNPAFAFPGVSGAPGTADVTSSLFSTRRGNGVFDPKPIPDLSSPKAQLKVSQVTASRDLESFAHGLVVEEFDGRPPPEPIMAGLVAYVRALSPDACPGAAEAPVTLAGLMDDVRRALTAAQALAARGDGASAAFLVRAARSRLALIDERFAAPDLANPRTRLRAGSALLGGIARGLEDEDPDAPVRLARWVSDSAGLQAALAAAEARSLFDPQRLAAAHGRRLPR